MTTRAPVRFDDDVTALTGALLGLDEVAAAAVLDRVAAEDPDDVLDRVVVPALVEIGNQWTSGDVSLSTVYMSGRLCQRLIESHQPPTSGGPTMRRTQQPRLAVGVLEDSHVLGKQIVVHLLRSSGYEVADWGARLGVEEAIERTLREDIDVLFLSVLMLRSALSVASVKRGLVEAGAHTLVVVGGAPFRFDPGLGSEVGADFAGVTASDVLTIMGTIEQRGGGWQR